MFKGKQFKTYGCFNIHFLGDGLKVCPRTNQTCCTLSVEQNFKGLGKKDFDSALAVNVGANDLFFDTQGKKFDGK